MLFIDRENEKEYSFNFNRNIGFMFGFIGNSRKDLVTIRLSFQEMTGKTHKNRWYYSKLVLLLERRSSFRFSLL
jgi:hypothetical protein